jgi:hypothetical protein
MKGSSSRSILEGERPDDRQTSAYHRCWMHRHEHHSAWAHHGLRTARHKLIYWYNSALGEPGAGGSDEPLEWEPFDCEAEPLELVNAADDPGCADAFEQMLRDLDAKMAEIGDIPEHDAAAVLAARRAAARSAAPESLAGANRPASRQSRRQAPRALSPEPEEAGRGLSSGIRRLVRCAASNPVPGRWAGS